MKIKLIKLIKSEFIKIFKRKSIYFLLFLSIITIIVYNYINPNQNEISSFSSDTKDVSITGMETALEKMTDNIEEYIYQRVSIDFYKLYNTFEENSWQRYALKEETISHIVNNVFTDYNLDIQTYLYNINDYEYNPNTQITLDLYGNSKLKYNEYVEALNSNNWENFVNLKIKNLEERKNTEILSDGEIQEINFETELYHLRLDNHINFDYNTQNQYLEQYKSNYYSIQLYQSNSYGESQTFVDKNINEYTARMQLCKYAIENNIEYDISNENNLIYDNKIDARISFIRTFEHFDLIIIIIAIYISSTIITEEITKKTIKNLLSKPHKRSSILMSKILACVITIFIAMIFTVIIQYLVGGFIFGFDSYALDYIGYDYTNGQVFTMNLFAYITLVGITKLPMYIIVILFCVFIGTFNKNIAMSMILTLIAFLFTNTILVEWSKVESLSIVTRFFITNNWDFSIYLFGNTSSISGINLWHSMMIYLIYFILFFKLALMKFNKIEV